VVWHPKAKLDLWIPVWCSMVIMIGASGIHDLRHTCAAWLVTAGVPLTEVRDLLGHSSVKMTERYAHLAPENVRAAVTLLEGYESHLSHVDKSANQRIWGKSLK